MKAVQGGIGEPGPDILMISGHLLLKECHNKFSKFINYKSK